MDHVDVIAPAVAHMEKAWPVPRALMSLMNTWHRIIKTSDELRSALPPTPRARPKTPPVSLIVLFSRCSPRD